MRISGVNRSSTVAWGASSEHSSLLAAGTVAGAISDNFDSSACLEVFKLDTSSPSGELSLLGSVQTSERFHRLAWHQLAATDSRLCLGLKSQKKSSDRGNAPVGNGRCRNRASGDHSRPAVMFMTSSRSGGTRLRMYPVSVASTAASACSSGHRVP